MAAASAKMCVLETFQLKTRNMLVRSEQNFTQTYGHTQGLCLCTNFDDFQNPRWPPGLKMAANGTKLAVLATF